ncbi:ECF transporter S component [Fructobacillus sp. M158]|uniref:ECF transporter S component n=1 Tax=Fructobacillus parabroussonetiae TaxID=2713174 RepID=UPI00200B6DF1|nr:ECF transporter S component [Fructobacillus parabroussonetiae]MCK8617079.1 ECF transporter S component [Fructobacillus parabroussonetiae]
MKNTQWKLRDAILLALIGIIFSVIYFLMDPLYQIISGGLTVIGLQAFAGELTIGVWMMAGPLAAYLLKKPGTALLAEMIGAAGEMFLGGYWGAATLISGMVQGAGSELGFTLTGYKKWSTSLWLSTLTGTVVTFVWQFFHSGYGHYHFGMLVVLFVVRYLSIFFFSGVLVKGIEKLLDRSKFMQTHTD